MTRRDHARLGMAQASAYLEANPTMPEWFSAMVDAYLALSEAQIAAKWRCDWDHVRDCGCWRNATEDAR